MSQGKPATERGRPREGDIIVTAVGEHYAIGRLKADRDAQEYLQSQEHRTVALQQACAQAGATYRVFLYPCAGTSDYCPVDCAAVVKSRTTGGKRTTEAAIERDVAAAIKHSRDLRDESAELNRTAKELAKTAVPLKGHLAKQKRATAMTDDPFYAPNRTPSPPGQPQPGERLFEFFRGHDRFRCELRDNGDFGIEAQFFENEELFFSRRFETRALAVQWAEEERKAIEKGGA
jgi:hypothetical protein